MARTDQPIKKLFKNKENFADLFNATIFQGEQVIKADKLIEISTEDIHIDNVSLEKENISDNIQEETEELEITKKEKILHVLTIVFYYSEKQWDGATHIHDEIQWSNKLNLKNIVPDYKMNLIWAYGQNDIDKFKSDLQYILYLVTYSHHLNP